MSLYVSSHYKNTPNDLILMSDAPAHHLFVLLAPVDETQNSLPDILAVVQVGTSWLLSTQNCLHGLLRKLYLCSRNAACTKLLNQHLH